MKKTLWVLFAAALAFALLGCPNDTTDNAKSPPARPDGEDGQIRAPILLPEGAYVHNTKIVIQTTNESHAVLYTLDGSDPDIGTGLVYDPAFPPRMKFEEGTAAITLKAVAVKSGRQNSPVVSAAYTERSLQPSPKMTALAQAIAGDSRGASASDPYPIVAGADWTLAEVELRFTDPEAPEQGELLDGLYYVFQASGGKYFTLDLSAVQKANWIDYDEDGAEVFAIAGISWTNGVNSRPNKNRLVDVTFPPEVEFIGPRAFNSCTGYKNVNLSGLSKLKEIAADAFRGNSLQSINFNGAVSLKKLGNYAFNGINNVTELDMSTTGIEQIGERVFGSAGRLEWIEYPKTLMAIGSYQFSNPTSLKYVRHRSLVQPDWAWCLYNYHNNPGGGVTATHMHEGIDQAYSEKTDHMFVIFHPNTSPWTKHHGGFNFADDDGYYFTAQNVPLGPASNSAAFDPAGEVSFYDALRGDALLAAQESYRGLPSLQLAITGLDALNGQTVTANTGQTGTIAGGGVTLNIGAPAATETLTPANAARDITIPAGDWRNKHAHSLEASDTWSAGGNTGNYAEPWVTHPGSPTQYAVLTLTLSGGGTLSREFTDARGIDEYGGKTAEKKTVSYVWVDQDVVLHRVMRASADRKAYLQTVALTLKAGWNLVETRTSRGVPDDGSAPGFGPNDGGSTSIWISGGIIGGDDDLTSGESTRDSLTCREIGWVKK
jgi:hypothetical protein